MLGGLRLPSFYVGKKNKDNLSRTTFYLAGSLRNIRFFKDGHLISAPSDSLELANSMCSSGFWNAEK